MNKQTTSNHLFSIYLKKQIRSAKWKTHVFKVINYEYGADFIWNYVNDEYES